MLKKLLQTLRKKGNNIKTIFIFLSHIFRTIIDKLKNENNALKDLIVTTIFFFILKQQHFLGEIK
jgi:hypothetical protein